MVKPSRCCRDVKNIIKEHDCCNKTKKTHLVIGKKINCYYNSDCLDDTKLYCVCANINDVLINYNIPRKRKVSGKKTTIAPNKRSNRIKGIKLIPPFVHTVKKVIIKYDCFNETILMKEEEEEIEKNFKRKKI